MASITSFFGSAFFGGEFFYSQPAQHGGAGGSDKAGKKHRRRGHAISAIQSGAYLEAFALPEDTPQQEVFTSEVEQYITSQAVQITGLEQLLSTITKALDELATSEVKAKQDKVARNQHKLQVAQYKLQVEAGYQRVQEEYRVEAERKAKITKRHRQEEEELMYILSHVW